MTHRITSPDAPQLNDLCQQLADLAANVDKPDGWPAQQLKLCGEYGVYEWFLEEEFGGQNWSDVDIIRGYLRLSAACMTTTFVITQRMGACRRIAGSGNSDAISRWLLPLLSGEAFATVGISHLTTSRRHLAKPVLQVEANSDGSFTFEGFSPWVTGAPAADLIVMGGTMDDGRQVLAAVPTDIPGITTPPPADLIGLSASHTGPVECRSARIDANWLLAGPMENVMAQGVGARTGGLQTSTLAIGLADAAIYWLEEESEKRADLANVAEAMRSEWQQVHDRLLAMAGGKEVCTNEDLRTEANSLVLRASQASLAAAKGTGYMVGHPTGRWCREALFFLVWSCPQPVMQAQLCELAGIE